MIILIVILIILLIVIFLIGHHLKPYTKDSVIMFCGGPGSGKTSTGVHTACSEVNKKRFKRWILMKIFRKKNIEKPYLYCNMPLYNTEYKEFTLDHLLRKKRFEYNSVIFINEASLMADSMLAYNVGKDEARKIAVKQIQEFCKLIRHELRGKGVCLIIDTQNPNDLCVAGDRVLNEMHFILSAINWIPFIRIVKTMKVMINIEGIQNQYKGDIDDTNERWIIVSKKAFKMYDTYCYEFLTRDLPLDQKVCYIPCKKRERKKVMGKPFIIPTLNKDYMDIIESNKRLENESEVLENGKEKN